MVDNAALERVKRIIRELQKKTTDNGCTEEEALAAAKMMGDLLTKHDLELDEVSLKAETAQCRKNVVRAADDYASSICVGVSNLCDLIVYRSAPGEFTFFGTPHDLEIGAYLYGMCMEALDWDCSRYMDEHGYSMKKRASFRMGFANRVSARLKKLKDERRRATTGTALVVLKDQLVKSEWDKQGIRLNKAKTQTYADPNAYLFGLAAGEKVNLNSPLTSGASGSTGQIR